MSKFGFRKFVPEMRKAFHFGRTPQQFYDAVIPVRGTRMKAGVEKYLSTPFKGITTDGNIVPGLFAFKAGDRAGARAGLMQPVVEKLTDDDIIAIAAYVASLDPL